VFRVKLESILRCVVFSFPSQNCWLLLVCHWHQGAPCLRAFDLLGLFLQVPPAGKPIKAARVGWVGRASI
jgi:hypothetical protein